MMLVIGEEGMSIEDLTVFLKAEIVDAVCLQQDSFDNVDRATPTERQVADFLLLMEMVHTAFSFEEKDELKKGDDIFSIINGLTFASCAAIAADIPAIPEPTISTSAVLSHFLGILTG